MYALQGQQYLLTPEIIRSEYHFKSALVKTVRHTSVVWGKWLLDRILFTLQLSKNIKHLCYAAYLLISEKAIPNEALV